MYERIRALREDRDLSQKQLSQALHCSQQVYSNYELASGHSNGHSYCAGGFLRHQHRLYPGPHG